MAVEAFVLFLVLHSLVGETEHVYVLMRRKGSHEIRLEIEEILLHLQLDEKWDWLWTEGSGCL